MLQTFFTVKKEEMFSKYILTLPLLFSFPFMRMLYVEQPSRLLQEPETDHIVICCTNSYDLRCGSVYYCDFLTCCLVSRRRTRESYRVLENFRAMWVHKKSLKIGLLA